jgi:hypothetical protein
MEALQRRLLVGSLAIIALTSPGCGVVPVPRVLEPVLGSRASYADTTLCVVDLSARRGLRVAKAQKEEKSGRVFLVEGRKRRKLRTAREDGYAASEAWFRGEEPIRQYGRRYVKYGPRRVVPASALTRGADHRGTPIFIDRASAERPAALYVPVEPGCVFQPYVDERYSRGK